MLYPSIQELLKATSNENGEKLNKYSLVMATAKCARIITNDYIMQRKESERKEASKDADKDQVSVVNKDYRDEKAVKNALREMKDGEFAVYLPGEQGYEESTVVVEDYKEPEKEIPKYIPLSDKKENDEKEKDSNEENESFDDFEDEEEESTADLMGATDVFDNDNGYTIEDAE